MYEDVDVGDVFVLSLGGKSASAAGVSDGESEGVMVELDDDCDADVDD